MSGRTLNSRTLALAAPFGLVVFGIVTGTAMSDPAAQLEQSQPASQSDDVKKQSELTPSQLVAQDFRTMAQQHATVGAANPGKEQDRKR